MRETSISAIPWRGTQLNDPITIAVTKDPCGYAIHEGILDLIDQAADACACGLPQLKSTPSVKNLSTTGFEP